MAYEVEVRPLAKRQIRRLPIAAQDQIRPVIRALANEPRPSGVVKLHGADDLYRVRSGDYRIVYQIRDAVLVVVVVTVGHRREVYR
jgi:mRNA interferase RelE/StbE